MIERQAGERRLLRGARREHVVPVRAVGHLIELGVRVAARDHPRGAQRGQSRHDVTHPRHHVDALARVLVRIDDHEHGGFDLAEAIEHPLGAEVG